VGRLLGDPEVWDDSPSRPRVLVRGLVGLAAGLVAGGLVALAVVPRPAAPPPEVAAPPPPAEGPVMGGLERPSAGRVLLDGVDMTRLPEAQLTLLRRRRLGFVWQGAARNLLPHASAWENLEVPMLLAGLPAGRRRRRARVLLDAVELGDAARKPIRALSGGEQQRLAVAVALANNPPLLLADEPTSQLDRANVQRVMELLKEAREDLGTTVVLVTHDGERVTVEVEPDRVVLRPTDRRSAGEAEEDGTP
jgi:peptide/nickel transport system ATP-binding protein